MKNVQKLVLALLVCTIAVGLSACQSPYMCGSPHGYQATTWQFSLVDTVNAAVYINGAPRGGHGCPSSGYGYRPSSGYGYNYRPSYMGGYYQRPVYYRPSYMGGYGGYQQPPRPQYHRPGPCGNNTGRVLVNNRNINNNTVRYIGR